MSKRNSPESAPKPLSTHTDTPHPSFSQDASSRDGTPSWDHEFDLNATIRGENSDDDYESPTTGDRSFDSAVDPDNQKQFQKHLRQNPPTKRVLHFEPEDVMTSEPNAAGDAASVDAIAACKLPDCWTENINLWFLKVEAEFQVNRVRKDEHKFNLVVRSLNLPALEEVADIIRAPPAENRYESLKNRLQQRFDVSAQKKLEQMLTCVQLGDKRPSQLYRHMAELAGNNATEDLLKAKWLTLLPTVSQNTLRIFKAANLQELLDAADTLMDAPIFPNACAVNASPELLAVQSRPSELSEIKNLLSELISVSREVLLRVNETNAKVASQAAQPVKEAPRRSRSTSRARPHTNGTCYYHNRFGAAATRCNLPCSANQQRTPPNNLN